MNDDLQISQQQRLDRIERKVNATLDLVQTVKGDVEGWGCATLIGLVILLAVLLWKVA